MELNIEKKSDIENITPIDALDLLWKAINKAAMNGTFNIDEAYTLKIMHHKLLSHIKQTNS